jgi:hypothetical protein
MVCWLWSLRCCVLVFGGQGRLSSLYIGKIAEGDGHCYLSLGVLLGQASENPLVTSKPWI